MLYRPPGKARLLLYTEKNYAFTFSPAQTCQRGGPIWGVSSPVSLLSPKTNVILLENASVPYLIILCREYKSKASFQNIPWRICQSHTIAPLKISHSNYALKVLVVDARLTCLCCIRKISTSRRAFVKIF